MCKTYTEDQVVRMLASMYVECKEVCSSSDCDRAVRQVLGNMDKEIGEQWVITYMVSTPNGEFNVDRIINVELHEMDEDMIRREAIDVSIWHLEGKLQIELLSYEEVISGREN